MDSLGGSLRVAGGSRAAGWVCRCTGSGRFQCSPEQAHLPRFAMQSVLEDIALEILRPHLHLLTAVDGLVVTGGVAYNRQLVTLLWEQTRAHVHIPAAPGDAGLPPGLLWAVLRPQAPPAVPASTFLGMPVMDSESAGPRYRAALQPQIVDAAAVAKVLAMGRAVATVRGRAEVGPRALGHRSVLLQSWLGPRLPLVCVCVCVSVVCVGTTPL